MLRALGRVVVVFPVGDQRIQMRLQGGVEGGGFVVGQGDLPAGGLVAAGFS